MAHRTRGCDVVHTSQTSSEIVVTNAQDRWLSTALTPTPNHHDGLQCPGAEKKDDVRSKIPLTSLDDGAAGDLWLPADWLRHAVRSEFAGDLDTTDL